MDKLVKSDKSGHWYNGEGFPCHTIIGKNGKERNTNVKDARELGLLPSVTSILSILAKPQLEAWKQEQAILASLTLPRLDNETEEDFAKRVVIDAKETSLKAMGLGTDVHQYLENWLTGTMQDKQEIAQYANPVIDWLQNNLDPFSKWESELRLASKDFGFAGTTDLFCTLRDGRTALIDFKTQGTKEKYGHKCSAYDEWCWQLSAYSLIKPADVLINIIISTGKAGIMDTKEWSKQEVENGKEIFLTVRKLFKLLKGV